MKLSKHHLGLPSEQLYTDSVFALTRLHNQELVMATADEVRSIFPAMVDRFIPEKAAGINATIAFDLSGENGGQLLD